VYACACVYTCMCAPGKRPERFRTITIGFLSFPVHLSLSLSICLSLLSPSLFLFLTFSVPQMVTVALFYNPIHTYTFRFTWPPPPPFVITQWLPKCTHTHVHEYKYMYILTTAIIFIDLFAFLFLPARRIHVLFRSSNCQFVFSTFFFDEVHVPIRIVHSVRTIRVLRICFIYTW
jgi:hypothetical protein